MIFYNHDREVISDLIRYNPRSCFVMTQLGGKLSSEVKAIRTRLTKILDYRGIQELDANSQVSGRDFLSKIWKLILSVPMGIAIVSEDMEVSTISNIFYEVGVLNALGKESIVVKTPGYKVPSDFVRTEYIEFNGAFENKVNSFLNQIEELSEHYEQMAEALENNPSLAIDYWRRAYLITGDKNILETLRSLKRHGNLDAQLLACINSLLPRGRRT